MNESLQPNTALCWPQGSLIWELELQAHKLIMDHLIVYFCKRWEPYSIVHKDKIVVSVLMEENHFNGGISTLDSLYLIWWILNFNVFFMFLLQGYAVLPLLPISFPIVWICLNLYGTARIKVLFTFLKEREKVRAISNCMSSMNLYNNYRRNYTKVQKYKFYCYFLDTDYFINEHSKGVKFNKLLSK